MPRSLQTRHSTTKILDSLALDLLWFKSRKVLDIRVNSPLLTMLESLKSIMTVMMILVYKCMVRGYLDWINE